ncbi:MAG: DNA/RNA non-specific endonuclease [Saprospiraceae bacterium]|nr:DNA/RNA non-specific endonuclease [Saprospiraceae bacterium]
MTSIKSGLGGIWGKLEDAVFNDVDVENLKISLIGGPVFNDDDRTYRSIKIPREFYKIIFYKVNGVLKSKAFLLTQNIDSLEALELQAFKVYEVALSELEQRCKFRFADSLKASIPEVVLEDTRQRQPIRSVEEIMW